ncbi:hypothetical protein RFI_18268 [Reticulomyxa filosa]|uniref:Uncharacterized protein n=1 Tax=Reticulomyxa filosa TaxID=46433 RepID=X6MYU5_RETFI|nr:hypothetical protein RFI_18268 [Reticulomyxa filosa]|eukprot:ETO18971.1 hypothetical protein RFI_18268 [Reticulomyxa filosa]
MIVFGLDLISDCMFFFFRLCVCLSDLPFVFRNKSTVKKQRKKVTRLIIITMIITNQINAIDLSLGNYEVSQMFESAFSLHGDSINAIAQHLQLVPSYAQHADAKTGLTKKKKKKREEITRGKVLALLS